MTDRAKGKPKQAPPTNYVVLQRVTSNELDPETYAWTPILAEPGIPLVVQTRTKKAAIDEAAQDRAGVFKPIALSAWKGGEERFEQTKLTAKPLEE